MLFTLVSTIFNEAKRLPQTIADLEAQTLQPTEIIITDAGSTDGTWEMLKNWQARSAVPIVLLQKQRCNVARGRNLAIAAAKCELIVSTDFGCRFHPQWLESLTNGFSNSDAKVVGGGYTVIESEIQTTAAKGQYLLTNGYRVDMVEGFIPSSRSIAFKKEVWQITGGYCEWLTLAADDLVFGMQIKALGIPIHLVPEPYVYWGRHLTHLQYAKEAFRYGLGDGEAHVNLRNTLVMLTETKLRYLFVLSIMVMVASNVAGYYPIITIVATALCLVSLAGFRPYVRTFKNWLALRSPKYHFGIFVYALKMLEEQRLTYLRGYMKGYVFATAKQKEGARLLHVQLKNKP
jgi:glycosyltransferase involved in cell wall biosynthesis